jgi:hypothetical protein
VKETETTTDISPPRLQGTKGNGEYLGLRTTARRRLQPQMHADGSKGTERPKAEGEENKDRGRQAAPGTQSWNDEILMTNQ